MSVDKFSQDVLPIAGGQVSQPQGAPQGTKGTPSPSFPHTSSIIPQGSERAAQATSIAKQEMAKVASALDGEAKLLDSHKISIDSEDKDSAAMKEALRDVAAQCSGPKPPEEVPGPAIGGIVISGEPGPEEPAAPPMKTPSPVAAESAVDVPEPEEEEDEDEEFEIGSKTSKQVIEKPSGSMELTSEEPAQAAEAAGSSPPAIQEPEEQRSLDASVEECLEGVEKGKAAILKPLLISAGEDVFAMARYEPFAVNGYQQGILTYLEQAGHSSSDIKLAVAVVEKLKEKQGIYGNGSWGIVIQPNGTVKATSNAINAQNLSTLPPHIAMQVRLAQARNQIIIISPQQYQQQLQKGAARAKAFCIAFSAAIKNYEREQDEKKAKKEMVADEDQRRSGSPSQTQQPVITTKTGEKNLREVREADEKLSEEKKENRELSKKGPIENE